MMKKLIAAIALTIGLSFSALAYTKGDIGISGVICTAEAAKDMARVAPLSKEDAFMLAQIQLNSGQCLRLPGPFEFQLVEKIISFVTYDNKDIEVWRVTFVGEEDTNDDMVAFFLVDSRRS